jgi:hypothetical protein
MRDENRKVWEELADERRKVEKLIGVVGHLWEMVGKAFPGHCEFDPSLFVPERPRRKLFFLSRFIFPIAYFMYQCHHSLTILWILVTTPISSSLLRPLRIVSSSLFR